MDKFSTVACRLTLVVVCRLTLAVVCRLTLAVVCRLTNNIFAVVGRLTLRRCGSPDPQHLKSQAFTIP
jgi:hypothetical protein